MTDLKKQVRIDEVKTLLEGFSEQHLASSPELAGYIDKLWDQVGRKRNYVITGGAREVWATAVVHVVARLNFLFDTANPNYLSADTICGHFGTKKSTVSARATEIEKTCRIRMGHEGLCSPELSDSLTMVKLSNGMLITKQMAKEVGLL